MKIFYGSDLHLEIQAQDFEVPECDLLLLAGDIFSPWTLNGREEEFFSQVVSRAKKCILVLGNHEHYHGYLEETLELTREYFSKFDNIVVLDNEYVEVEDVIVFGSTLWSEINPTNALSIRSMINDYRLIKNKKANFLTVDDTNELNWVARNAINKFLQSFPAGKRVIMMTHHAPFAFSTSEKYRGSNLNEAFVNKSVIDPYNVGTQLTWIHGHTHDKFDYEIGDVHVLCNPRGYGNECKEFVFEKLV